MEKGITLEQFLRQIKESVQYYFYNTSFNCNEVRDFSEWFLDFMRFGLNYDGEVIDAMRAVLEA